MNIYALYLRQSAAVTRLVRFATGITLPLLLANSPAMAQWRLSPNHGFSESATVYEQTTGDLWHRVQGFSNSAGSFADGGMILDVECAAEAVVGLNNGPTGAGAATAGASAFAYGTWVWDGLQTPGATTVWLNIALSGAMTNRCDADLATSTNAVCWVDVKTMGVARAEADAQAAYWLPEITCESSFNSTNNTAVLQDANATHGSYTWNTWARLDETPGEGIWVDWNTDLEYSIWLSEYYTTSSGTTSLWGYLDASSTANASLNMHSTRFAFGGVSSQVSTSGSAWFVIQ